MHRSASTFPVRAPSPSLVLRELEALLNNAGAGIVFIRTRQVVRCNARFAELFGFASPAAVMGQRSELFSLSRAAYRDLGRSAYPLISNGKRFVTEREMRRRDGTHFWARLTGSLVNVAEPLDGAVWVVDDLNEQLASQAQLDAALWEKQTLFDHAMVGILHVTGHTATRCNSFYERMLGYEPGELTGRSTRCWFESEAQWEHIARSSQASLLRGETFACEARLRRKDGSVIACELRAMAMDPSQPELRALWIVMDTTERQSAKAALAESQSDLERLVEQRTLELRETVKTLHQEMQERRIDRDRIHKLAHFDSLTGLPNRALLAQRSSEAIASAGANGTPLAVLFLDLDHFKHVNDSLGHRVGDALLVQIAQRLRAVVRDKDTVCRVGGDEFILLLPGANEQGAERVAGKLLEASRLPYLIHHHELTMAPSMGIAVYPRDGEDFDTLSQSADVAMYRAKQGGRNTYRFFTPEMQAESVRALQLENALRRALERGQLSLHYQPQFNVKTGELRGVEALLRWEHPELGHVSPAEFIPLAEDTGQILAIGDWVLRTALAQWRAWHEAGYVVPSMAVNLSAVQFRQPGMPERIGQLLAEIQVPAHTLELELTEGVALDDPQSAAATMAQLDALGVRLAIDDFGTGYSSLSLLKQFPICRLKIDQSFVRDLEHDSSGHALIIAIVRMAEALGLKTTAEGVETPEQLGFLREHGCNEVQGFHCGRPMPAEAFAIWLTARKTTQP